jgi:hypothetical protein
MSNLLIIIIIIIICCMLHVFFNVPLINSLSAKKKKKKKEEHGKFLPNVIFNKDPTAVLRLHERPQATDNSMQLLNLHQTNGNGNTLPLLHVGCLVVWVC